MTLTRHLPRFRAAYRSLDMLAERETWSRAQVEAFQLERINALWAHAGAHVPYYRRLAVDAGLPARFGSLSEFQTRVPVLHKSTVREAPTMFRSEIAARGSWKCTSGSTGATTRVFWSHDAHLENLRVRYRLQQMWGVDIFDRWVFLWGHSASFRPGTAGYLARLQQPVVDRLRNRLRLSPHDLSREALSEHLQRLAAFRPHALYCYSTAGYLLAQEAEAAGFQCDSLKLVILSAEPAFPHMIRTVERAFRAPVVVEYGSVECGSIGGTWPDKSLHVREDYVFLETLPRPDARFDVVVTVLTNPSFPIMRYMIGDLTDAPLEQPERGFAILRGVMGRNNDLVLSRSGRIIHSSPIEFIFENNRAVRRYRLQQHADGSVEVAVELTDPSQPVDAATIEAPLSKLLEGCPVKLAFVDELPLTASGKHRWIMSNAVIAGTRQDPSGQPS